MIDLFIIMLTIFSKQYNLTKLQNLSLEIILRLDQMLKNNPQNIGGLIERFISLAGAIMTNECCKNNSLVFLRHAIDSCAAIHEAHFQAMVNSSGHVLTQFYDLVFQILVTNWRILAGTKIHPASEENVAYFMKLFEVILRLIF